MATSICVPPFRTRTETKSAFTVINEGRSKHIFDVEPVE